MPPSGRSSKFTVAEARSGVTGFTQKTWKHGVLIVLFVTGMYFLFSSMLNDVTGEYGANDGLNVIHMSVARKDGGVVTQLSDGPGPLLEAQMLSLSSGDTVDWTFTTPERWRRPRVKIHQVRFHGTVEDGHIKGVLQEGASVVPVNLPRDPIATVYRILWLKVFGG